MECSTIRHYFKQLNRIIFKKISKYTISRHTTMRTGVMCSNGNICQLCNRNRKEENIGIEGQCYMTITYVWVVETADSNLKRYTIDPKERLPSGHTLPWRAWRTSNRVRSGQATTPAAKHLWGYRDSKNCMCGASTCDLNHIMTSCTHFGERPSLDDIAEMKDGYVRWLRVIADTI